MQLSRVVWLFQDVGDSRYQWLVLIWHWKLSAADGPTGLCGLSLSREFTGGVCRFETPAETLRLDRGFVGLLEKMVRQDVWSEVDTAQWLISHGLGKTRSIMPLAEALEGLVDVEFLQGEIIHLRTWHHYADWKMTQQQEVWFRNIWCLKMGYIPPAMAI